MRYVFYMAAGPASLVVRTRGAAVACLVRASTWSELMYTSGCNIGRARMPFVLAPTRAIQTKHALAGEPAQLVPEGLDPSPHPPLP